MPEANKYYRILEIEPGASIGEIKKAYRICARKYHPDLNKEKNCKDLFIEATEAYEFLLSNYNKGIDQENIMQKQYEEWLIKRQEEARKRAYAYSRARYKNFTQTKFYRSSRVLDLTQLIFNFIISLMIIVLAINGFIRQLTEAEHDFERPSVAGFIFLLSVGLIFMAISLFFTNLYLKEQKKHGNRKK